ncbi:MULTISPECIES: copper-binding protein [unclassified Herbaspirillum]|uniref:copper-binding protein n=1 Tax=unclassified Herbaspirillum TaxID=2624150 RepID=UPI00116FBED4|nr:MULTISPECIES: copper-binding protein [unclassified Herbaspirillum]MBB5390988.1 Cu/Ag efflux protein CusF [Herbaspirillum sp. SJZ102]TQK06506.1 Cu/Ag efflux protein CusF [Herbaspirillum sp. SJZ130]TQK12016.1 Cu/Ag efflux protein CusF [Herbaspirillum sp. SJZ106]TWC64658.1 Cu/Ag efflux protein CusF [Herbaspirillum sp. SJZ099]
MPTAIPTISRLLLAAALALPAFGALAQDAAPQVQGEIRKVDAGAGKLTIRHAEIPNLEMPPMTMVFRAAPELLAKAREGDKVNFTAQRVDGALTVTSLAPRE